MEIVPAERKHITLLQYAFDRQREAHRQRAIDYLAQPGVWDFHRDRLCATLEKNPSSPFSLYLQDNEPAAIVSVEKSPWHSRHYGFPYMKIQPFYCLTEEGPVIYEVIRTLAKTFTRDKGTVYTTRIDGHAAALAYFMGLERFIHVGTSVRMILQPQNRKTIDNPWGFQYDSVKIRDFQEADLPALQRIGGQNHGHSHFFREIRFPMEKTQALFAEWIEKCAGGIAKRILVAEVDGKAAGFSTLLINDSLVPYIQQKIGIVDFIVVDAEMQGKGVSGILLQAALSWLFESVGLVELRTMSENLRAIRFYEKNGFQILSSDHHFHYWT